MPRYAERLWLRGESQCNDRQVLPTPMIAHIKVNGSATVAGDRCVRSGTWRTARPPRARFVSRALTRWQQIMIDLMRRLTTERRVRATMIVPIRKRRQLHVEPVRAKRHQNDARAFVLETQNEPFNERDAPVLTNGAEAGFDPIAVTPIFKHATPELLALVADDVFRGGTGGLGRTFEKVRN